MALGDANVSVEEYLARTGKTSTEDNLALAGDLLAVTRHIAAITVRPLGFQRDDAGGAAVARVYQTCQAWRRLDIDDHVSISSVAYDSAQDGTYATTVAANDYEKLPRSALTGPEVQPYRTLEATLWGDLGIWPANTRVKVTGYGGWPAVPEAIKSATIELTSILRIESPRATNSINEFNQVVSTSKVARDIVAELVRTYRLKRTVL